nr:MAG TPA: tail tape measure protein [Caudoviricetes sp.]
MAQDTIDKIINIQFRYSDLIKGWEAASAAIDTAKVKLQEFKKAGDSEGVAKQTQLIKALRTEMSAYTREIQANIREEINLDGSVEKLRAGVQALTAQYNKLSREERNNADVGGKLSSQIREMQTELNEANASLLNFRDNVGNYASAAKGFTPLTFQVQQLARELPSLTMSAQQFFLAISNNLPMFADELTRARMANKALRAEGKPTVSVFKQVLSAIGSWQTALVVGITLLTAYGKEIGAWVKGLFTAKEAALSMAEAQDKVNDALKKDGYGIGEQIAKVKELQMQWRALGDDLKARKQFIVDNKDAFDDLGVKVTNVNDAENLLVTNTGDFINALSMRARAAAGMKLAAEAYEKALIEQQKVEEEIKKGYTTQRYVFGGSPNGEDLRSTRPYTEAEEEELMAPVRALEAQAEAYLNVSVESQNTASEILKNAGIEEAANDKVNKKVKKGITLAEQRAQAVKAARESIVKDITAIGNALDKELADAFKDGNNDITKGLESQLEEQARKYQNRLLEATLSGGSLGTAKETIAIAKEQLSQLDDIASNEELVNRLGWDDVELQRQRLDLRMQIANAEQSIAREQDRTAQEAARQTAQTLSGLSGMTGAFSAMFEALGGEGERYAEFSKALAIFEVALQQAQAIAGAVANAAKYSIPWLLPVQIASSVAAVIAAIAQATQVTDSAQTPKYASGGLVTGPGTGTSDSIPAMLSNGEAVMTAQAVNDWGAMLSAMNVASGGNAIQVSNLPQRNDGMKGMERMMERALMNMPAPIVSVVDINKGQKRVKVQNSLGKLGRKKYE